MQVIKLSPSQPNITGLVSSDVALVLCDSDIDDFSISVPIGKSSIVRELRITNTGENNVFLVFDNNSPLFTSSGSVTTYTLIPDECIIICNDKLTGLWYHSNKITSITAKFGDVANGNYAEFESDGTLVFHGDATGFVDIDFPVIIRTSAAGTPTLATFQGNLKAPQWAVNDYYDADDQELIHPWKEASTTSWHVHVWTGGADVDNRYLKFELEYTWANVGSTAPTNTTITTGELLIPANTPALTHLLFTMGTFTPVSGKIAAHVKARLKRIASTGTAPTANPFISKFQMHVECDTVFSRQLTTK